MTKEAKTYIPNLTLNAKNPLVSQCSYVNNPIVQSCILIDAGKLYSFLHHFK